MARFPQTHTYYLELSRRTSDEYDGKCGRKFGRKMDSKSQKKNKEMREMDQREVSLEEDARQSRLAMVADGPANTRERTEGAATAVQAMHGNSCSADRVDPDPTCSTSFGDDCTGPPAPPCSEENALVNNRAAVLKPVSHPWRCAHQ